jgi:hypothetical protein
MIGLTKKGFFNYRAFFVKPRDDPTRFRRVSGWRAG